MPQQPLSGFITGVRQAIVTRLAKRLTPAGKPYALPEQLTGSQQQAAYAKQLQYQAEQQQQQVTRRYKATTGGKLPVGPTMKMPVPGSPADQVLQSIMQTNMAPQANPAGMFAPGAPMPVVQGITPAAGPRQFSYPVGYNINPTPRSTELETAAQLRTLALLYDGIQLCEQVYFDVLSRLEPVITFAPNVIPDGQTEYDPRWQEISRPALEWVCRPDGNQDLSNWLCAAWRDVLELGFAAIYQRRDRLGRVHSLELVDAGSIKPLLDERGRVPAPPFAAYQQYLYGVPGGLFTRDELVLFEETARTDSAYPFSRVSRMITAVNQALRKQNLDLTRYTDGAIPEGMLIPALTDDPSDWGPEQLQQFQDDFADVVAGNDAQRTRMRVALPGSTWVTTRPADPQLDFDRFLLNITVGIFGLTMDEIAMTENSNRSVGRTQQDVVYRRSIKPLANRFARYFTRQIQEKFDRRLLFQWGGIVEEEDLLVKAQTLQIGVNVGALSASRMARMMNWPVDTEVPPYFPTKAGPVWIEDALRLRQAQQASGQAATEFPVSEGDASDDDEDEDDDAKPAAKTKAATTKPAPKPAPGAKAPGKPAPAPTTEQRADFRRYYAIAKKVVKEGKRIPPFQSAVIHRSTLAQLETVLSTATTMEQVRAAFATVRPPEPEERLP